MVANNNIPEATDEERIQTLIDRLSAYIEQWMIVMGTVFIITMLWTPDGILGVMRRLGIRVALSNARAGSHTSTPEERE